MHVMSDSNAGLATGGRRTAAFVQRMRFQLGGGILAGTALPMLCMGRIGFSAFADAGLRNALAGAVLAIVAGFFLNRRFRGYPGVNAGSSIPVAYSCAFAFVLVTLIAAGAQYSIPGFAISYLVALAWYVAIDLAIRHNHRPRLAVVPGGDAGTLFLHPGVSWHVLDRPALPQGVGGLAADLRHDHAPQWHRFLADCILAGVPVYHSRRLAESLAGKVAIEHLSENAFGTLQPDTLYLRAKRLADILLALAALPVFLLVLVIVAPAIMAGSGGPVFFRQERVGLGGKVFRLYKFRTMRFVTGANVIGDAVAPAGRECRITPIGRFLRKHRIDELPQIINVLRGQMSWIGPRPEALPLADWYESELPFYRYRHVVPPGITGWAQVNQGHVALPSQVLEKLHYDFFYIKHLSPWLDLLIALRTVGIVFSGAGAR